MTSLAIKLGNFYNSELDLKLTEEFYLLSFKVANELKNSMYIKNSAETVSNFYLKIKKFEKAYNYLKITKIMSDSLSNFDKQTNMAVLETKFEFERIKSKEHISAEEAKRERTYRNSLIVISVLTTIIGIVVLLYYRRKKRDNQLLTIQKNEIETQLKEIKNQKNELEKMWSDAKTPWKIWK